MNLHYGIFLVASVIGWLSFPQPHQAMTICNRLGTFYTFDQLPSYPISPMFLKSIATTGDGSIDHKDGSIDRKKEKAEKEKKEEALKQHRIMRMNAMVQRTWVSSMVIPGLGQIYNRDYWKVPVIYFLFGVLGRLIYSQHKEMHSYRRKTLYLNMLKGEEKQHEGKFAKMRQGECKRARNLYILILGAIYIANVLDAFAKAHDKMVNFIDDIDTTLSPTVDAPTMQPTKGITPTICLSCSIYF